MARIDRALLDSAILPHCVQMPIRFDDLDVQGHVNNAAAVVLMQEARVSLNRDAGLQVVGGELRMMVAALQVEFAAELRHPGLVEIHNGVLQIGRTSFTVVQVARQDGRSAIYAQSVLVMADANGPAPMLDSLRESYGRFLVRQSPADALAQ